MASVDTFNELLLQFVDELAHTFPENTIVKTYRNTVGMLIKKDPGVCLETFMKNVKPHEELIRNQDERIFEELSRSYGILKTLDLESMWKSELSDNSRSAIWQYVQGLYVLGNNVGEDEIQASRQTNMDFSPEKINQLFAPQGPDGQENPLAGLLGNLMKPEIMEEMTSKVEEQFGDGQGGLDETKIMSALGPLMGNLTKILQQPPQ
ncbi:MAG: hypothetical protein ACO3SE_09180 [Sedimenticolaceae bacterium]